MGPYNIMFGPDICGPGTKKVHVIFNYKGKNLLIKKDIRCKDDELTHVYTLIVKSDLLTQSRLTTKMSNLAHWKKIGTSLHQKKFLTQTQKSQMTGMKKQMVNGSQARLTTQNTKVSGNQSKLKTLHTRDHGFTLKLPTLIMRLMTSFTSTATLAPSVLICGR